MIATPVSFSIRYEANELITVEDVLAACLDTGTKFSGVTNRQPQLHSLLDFTFMPYAGTRKPGRGCTTRYFTVDPK